MNTIYFGNSTRQWLTAAGIAVVAYLVLILIQRVLISRLGRLAEKTDTDFDDALVSIVRSTRYFFFAAIALQAALRGLHVSKAFEGPLQSTLELLVLLQIGLWATGIVVFMVERSLAERRETADRIGVAAVRAIGITVKVVAWTIIVLIAIQNVFDKNILPLMTGLGVGGIAIALAVQNILGDLLAAVAIVFDRPFDVGDTIQVDDLVGTVEQIGLKTTRLRSVTGEQLVLGNGEILKSKLRNYKRMYERRALLHLDVTYDTPPETLERIPDMVKQIVEAQAGVRFDRSHFARFMESALRVETVYFVVDPDYRRFMDVQQAVNIAVLRRFNADGIDFAFPTRTMIVPPATSAPESSPRPLQSTAP
ncbi:MAG: mechanosensitive ion channel family protein [Gemmatimonadaceae bacterium]